MSINEESNYLSKRERAKLKVNVGLANCDMNLVGQYQRAIDMLFESCETRKIPSHLLWGGR